MCNNRSITNYLICILILLFTAQVIYSIDSNTSPDSFTFEKIQTPGVSNTLLEDRDGFIWVGTDMGLWLYNGYEFKSFTHIIPERIDAGMYQDHDGYIWIGTGNGLIKFDPLSGERTTYRHDDNISGSISNHVFQYKKYTFCEDLSGRLWIATDNGLNLFNKEDESFTAYTSANSGMIDNFITAIIPSRDGLIWVATFRGLQKFDPVNKEVLHYYPGAPFNMYALCEDCQGDLWIGSYLDGLYRLDYRFSRFSEYKHIKDDETTISSNMVTYLLNINKLPNLMFIATFDGGLNVLNINTGKITHFRDDLTCQAKNGISGDSLAQIIQDKMGSLFILNEHGFLNRMDPETKRFSTLTAADDESINVPKASLYSVWTDNDGNIWMLAGRNKISKYNKDDNAFVYQYRLSEDILGLAAVDNDNTIWMSGDGFIVNVNTDNGRINTSIPIDGLRLFGLNDVNNSNVLWFGSTNSGLIKLDKNKKLVSYLDEEKQARVKIILAQEESGGLWISSFGEGLQKFDTNSEKLIAEYNLTLAKTGNPSGFFKDSKERCWVSFQNDGPALFDPADGNFIYFESYAGAPWPAKGSSGILEDRNGILWISGNGSGEIVKFEPDTKKISLYTQSDGVALGTSGTFCQQPVKENDGSFWFSGMGGVTKFYPETVKDNEYKPPVFISELMQNGKRLYLSRDENTIPVLRIPSEKNYFEFEAVALNYRLSENNKYKYRLIGRDNEWIETGTRRNGFYSGLEEGMYRLEVMGSNNDGIWCDEPAQLNIYVEPDIPDDYVFIQYSELNGGEKRKLKHNSNNLFIEAVEIDFSILNSLKYKYKLEDYDEDWSYIINERYISYQKIPAGKYFFKVVNTDSGNEKNLEIIISPAFYKSWWFLCLIILAIIVISGLFWHQSVNHLRKEQEEMKRHRKEEQLLDKSRKEALEARITAATERENAVKALQISEERNSELLAAMTEGFIISDKNWQLKYANDRFCQMIGYGADEIKHRNILEFIDEVFQEKLKSNLTKLKSGEKTTFEMRWIRNDNKRITTLISSSPLVGKDGEYKESFAVITDISKLKETEEILLNSQKELMMEKDKLEEVNTALKVLLKKRDDDIEEVKSRLQLNIRKLVVPYTEKLLKTRIDEHQKKMLEIINTNLSDIAMELSQKLKLEYADLTYSEIQVAYLIRDGLETKEIASDLNISMRTVEFHRANIRKKLGLKGKSVNLRDYLMNLHE